MIGAPIKVLIVDDSAVVRGLMAKAVQSDPAIQLSGTAMHGAMALAALRKNCADVVVMDVEMPVMDGITALTHILKEFPQTKVVMASGQTYEGAETTLRALSLGAAGCIAKPVAKSTAASIEQVTRELLPLIKALRPARLGTDGSVCLLRRAGYRFSPYQTAPLPVRLQPPRVVVIGSSTGGPQALRVVVSGLKELRLPILITQHMPPMFTPMLAKHLGVDTGRTTYEATNGMELEPHCAYVAPGDFHLQVCRVNDRYALRTTKEPPEHFCRPSVNPMFRSASRCFGGGVVAVMLTGMGDDGIEATHDVVANGGYVIAQDERSSVVWGMPGAVVRAQLAHEVLPLEDIAIAVLRRCKAGV